MNTIEDGVSTERDALIKKSTSTEGSKLNDESSRNSRKIYAITLSAMLVLLAVMGVSYRNSSSIRSKVSGFDASTLSVKVTNEYGDYMATMFNYPFLENGLLVEPYRETTFTIGESSSSCTYDWKIKGVWDDSFSTDGRSSDGTFVSTLTKPGQYSLSISEYCDGAASRSVSMDVWVKYVRRELTNLNDQDREDFLDAFRTLWDVSTVDGQKLYGEKYKSLFYFAIVHNDAGANPVCDQFHGSVGFINNHLYLGLYLEQSLQMINPKVALHYMDYTKYFSSDAWDSHMENQVDGGTWTELMTEKWFGSNDPYTGEIVDGRWAGTPIPRVSRDFYLSHGVDPDKTFYPQEEELWLQRAPAHIPSPYGLMRAPWNYNAANYTTRYNNIQGIKDASELPDFREYIGVNCDFYSSFIKLVKGQSLSYYLDATENSVHGMVHFTTGGNGGTWAAKSIAILREKYGFDDAAVVQLAHSYGTFFKEHIRTNSFTNPLECTDMPWDVETMTLKNAAAVGEDGGPTCNFVDATMNKLETLNKLIETFYSTKGGEPTLELYGIDYLMALSLEDRRTVMQMIANLFVFNGDMNESSAAADPLYWVAHGAVERLFQFTIFNDWLSDYEYDTDSECTGHMKDGVKAWLKGYYFNDETIAAETLTNEDLIAILHPQKSQYRDLLNFVYDVSDYSWCNTKEWYD